MTNPPIVIQSNQNNSVNSSNTYTTINSTVKSHDEIAKMLTQSHSGSM